MRAKLRNIPSWLVRELRYQRFQGMKRPME